MKNDKVAKLEKYAEHLRQRLSGTIPPKFTHRPEIFKEMIEIDLKKTLSKIQKLS